MNDNSFNIKINNENFYCPIDYNFLDNPVECIICHHNFCLKCYNERIEYLKKNNLEIIVVEIKMENGLLKKINS